MTLTRSHQYLGALAALVLAVALRWFIDPVLGDQAPTVTMYGAVAIAALLGGPRLGVPVALIGFLACAYLFLPPRGHVDLTTARNLISLVAYLTICGMIIGLAEARRTAQARLAKLQDEAPAWSGVAPLSIAELRQGKALQDPVLVAFLFCLAVLVIGGVAGYQSTRRLAHNERLLEATTRSITDLNELLSTVKDAETGQRGYLLTGNEVYIQPYNNAVATLPKQLEVLRQRLADDPDQLGRLNELERTIDDKMEELSVTIAARRAGAQGEAMSQVRSNRGQELMESVRRRVAEMQDLERRVLLTRSVDSQESLRITMLAILLTSGIGVTLLIAVFSVAQHSLRERQQWGNALTEQRERFRVTLASIGDGVITTDVKARVTSLNPVAEQVTGWKSEEAEGKALSEIFTILNETSRKPVENPAHRALSEGIVIGLANHTVLVRKDGTEVPI
ncbi:MAG TPA: CHASE3 domain-containing protein, partial [Gemmatimonadales bacterium]|nr:CHASE3 domain-containing protein [Gemmatimonadales bacterium]